MTNLKELKGRIKSVKSTQKITGAMHMVAAARLRRACNDYNNSNIYTKHVNILAHRVYDNMETIEHNSVWNCKIDDNTLHGTGHLVLAISSDRGLCGSFNSNIVRSIKSLMSEENKIKLFFIGHKAYDHYKLLNDDIIVDHIRDILNIDYAQIIAIADSLLQSYSQGEFTKCTIIHNHFVNVMVQQVKIKRLMPFAFSDEENINKNVDSTDVGTGIVRLEFEPKIGNISHEVARKYIASNIYNTLKDSITSEYGARMTAMDHASRNASSMIEDLTLVYNRTRQATITSELIEIISGAESLKKE